MNRKPMKAENYVADKVKFPVMVQPKIDGVRGINTTGNLTTRTLKSFANKFNQAFFSHEIYKGFDGEFAAEKETHPRLCNLTTSALFTIAGEPYVMWWVFDYLTPDTIDLPYKVRYDYLCKLLSTTAPPRVRLVPCYTAQNITELEQLHSVFLQDGYEGTILRSPDRAHKAGRSTVREGGLLRIKDFVEEEAIVIGIIEAEENQNEAKINELGLSSRSSHQANKMPKGQIGALLCVLLKDSEQFKAGDKITVSKGNMTEEEAIYYFRNQTAILNKTIKFKHFPKGVKDKPRFPTWSSMRDADDI